jgi:uncharacterized protein YoxC
MEDILAIAFFVLVIYCIIKDEKKNLGHRGKKKDT